MRVREFLFTACYSGYCPVAPGSAGTLVGMAVYILGYLLFGEASWAVNLAMVVILFIPFVRLVAEGERFFGVKDPPQVTLDEVMGYWVSVLFYPFNIKIAFAAFVIFRIMDILKPWPIGRLEKLPGGFGIMIDDCVAGVYTNLILLVTVLLFRFYTIPL
jgi:phosphatidylglycerophosphatase A